MSFLDGFTNLNTAKVYIFIPIPLFFMPSHQLDIGILYDIAHVETSDSTRSMYATPNSWIVEACGSLVFNGCYCRWSCFMLSYCQNWVINITFSRVYLFWFWDQTIISTSELFWLCRSWASLFVVQTFLNFSLNGCYGSFGV